MAELQSCPNHGLGLMSTECSALNNMYSPCIEFPHPSIPLGGKESQEKGEGVNVVGEISAELQRERQKNAELMERISLLEAQIQERDKASLSRPEQDGSSNATDRGYKKFKRQKIEARDYVVENVEFAKNTDLSSQIKHHIPCMAPETNKQPDHIVNWMSMDDSQILNFDKFKDGDSTVDCGDTDDTDEDDTDIDDKDRVGDKYSQVVDASKIHLMSHEGVDGGPQCLEISPGGQIGLTNVKQEIHGDTYIETNVRELKRSKRKESKRLVLQKASLEVHCSGQEIGHNGSGNLVVYRKPTKVAFCPQEVRRMMESEVLLLKNAQSHTIRKIIVFASLGIRHGCEDMYELDFSHFKILWKGEPYVSPKDPGEHVLYEQPGVRSKVFYPNQQNPILCPVHILEEEKVMRPSDPSCPSCLFLCIKYGGRTRNLPQNEYVRQRMGRNKLKSFGPLMCQMASLVHIRSGSFFFKALGITLLFMAGFPDELVQRETKYRNLDLLQKYYRTDEAAEGEDLFCLYPTVSETEAIPTSQKLTGNAISTAPKPHGKKQTPLISKSQNLQKSSRLPSVSSISVPSTQVGLMGYASIHTQPMPGFHPIRSHTLTDISPISNTSIPSGNTNNTSHIGQSPPPYPMFPPYPMNTLMPLSFWHNTNTYPPCPYPTSYGYPPFHPSMNYISHHSQPHYSHPSCYPFMPKAVESSRKKQSASEVVGSDSDSSSSGMEQKMALTSCEL
ncbi:uncharacterized protein LOC143884123 [Tasmannia lanceolata]|uniref:uncharacterized protein LOC143884123 n=1 Tax=Tasmannia lanceolata TaxID=3420 RepID=UPI0040632CEE